MSKVQSSGRVKEKSLVGKGLPEIYGLTKDWGPAVLPIITADREGRGPTYTVRVPAGTIRGGTIILKGVRLYWSWNSAVRAHYQERAFVSEDYQERYFG